MDEIVTLSVKFKCEGTRVYKMSMNKKELEQFNLFDDEYKREFILNNGDIQDEDIIDMICGDEDIKKIKFN